MTTYGRGATRTLVGLHGRIHGRITDPARNAVHLNSLGVGHHRLGDYRQAIDLYTQALAIARDTGKRQGEASALGGLGICHHCLGDYRQAIDLHTQALAIARDIGNRRGEASALGNLGTATQPGRDRQAIDLHTQALAIARDIGHRQGEGIGWATWGSATTTWATTGRPSTCTRRPWPSPATPATARARPARWATWGSAITPG